MANQGSCGPVHRDKRAQVSPLQRRLAADCNCCNFNPGFTCCPRGNTKDKRTRKLSMNYLSFETNAHNLLHQSTTTPFRRPSSTTGETCNLQVGSTNCQISPKTCAINRSLLHKVLTFDFNYTILYICFLIIFLTSNISYGAPLPETNNQTLITPKIVALDVNVTQSIIKEPKVREVILSLPAIHDENMHTEFDIEVIKDLTNEDLIVNPTKESRVISKRGAKHARKPRKQGRRKRCKNNPKKCRKKNKKGCKKNNKRNKKKCRKTRKKKKKPKLPDNNVLTNLPEASRMKTNHPKWERLYNDLEVDAFHLAVDTDGRVYGEHASKTKQTPHSVLRIQSIDTGIMAIYAVEAERYICVTPSGKVTSKIRYEADTCLFHEKILMNNKVAYESKSCKNCFLGMKANGEIKRAHRVNMNLIEAHFLPSLVYDTSEERAEQQRRQTESLNSILKKWDEEHG